MNYADWEQQFKQHLRQKLQLSPEQINFHWQACFSQRQTPEEAIAFLLKTHQQLPQLKILPIKPNSNEMINNG